MKKAILIIALLGSHLLLSNANVVLEIKFKNFSEFEDLKYYRVNFQVLKPVSPFTFCFENKLFDNNGDASFKSEVEYSTLGIIGFNNHSIVLPIFPNDTIKLEVDLSVKNNSLESMIVMHTQSNIETDAFINNLNLEAGGIYSGCKEVTEKYISTAKSQEQKFLSVLYLSYLNRENVNLKHQQLRFLAFEDVYKQYPEVFDYDNNFTSLITNAKLDFEVTSKENIEINVHNEEFTSFSALLDKIKKDHKGKIVFIDFWGTWCGACIYDIEKKKQLGMDKIFKENEVIPIYLCHKSPYKEFNYYVKKHDIKGEHYIVSKELAMDARIKFNVMSFPHYMLLSKDGNVINNIPRPVRTTNKVASLNPEFIELIELLK